MWNLPEQEKGVHQGFQGGEEGEDDPVHHPFDVVPHVLRLHRLKHRFMHGTKRVTKSRFFLLSSELAPRLAPHLIMTSPTLFLLSLWQVESLPLSTRKGLGGRGWWQL
jgi:hypothetical protein